LQEIDEKEFFKLFDELDALTTKPFAELKAQIDSAMCKRFSITPEQLRPWHYGDLFFQEAPTTGEIDLDTVWKGQDLAAITKRYYDGLEMPIDAIMARSDMYEKPKKSQHAFCTSIDRVQDIRVLCNLKDNAYWADTIVHEVGHAVYEQYIREDVPFILHEPAHSLTTEGMVMMFGSFTKNEDFLVKVRKLSPGEAGQVVAAAA